MLPKASFSWTVIEGLIGAPAFAFVGCCMNASCAAEAALIVNALLTADVNEALVAVNCFDPTRLMLRSLNVARPLTSVACVVVPLSVPVPLVKATETSTPELRTSLSYTSLNCTVTDGEMVAPADALVGCCT